MSDPDKPWRLPDAKPMTFDEMTARAQYEWQRAEDAEAEARALGAERDAAQARADALAEKLEKAVKGLEDIADGMGEVSKTAVERFAPAVARATLAEITGEDDD